jgi:hypothetical protein
MKYTILSVFFLFVSYYSHGQQLIIEEGMGVGPLKLGQSFEEVVNILGFSGDLKTYEDYLAEELFFVEPDRVLECVIGFDYYVKYEHLLTLPVSYVFFKDNVINQIKLSSFPEYYFSIARNTKTSRGLEFWTESNQLQQIYGLPDLQVNYDSFILRASFYFDEGITFFLRDDHFRTAHVYIKQSQNLYNKFKSQF